MTDMEDTSDLTRADGADGEIRTGARALRSDIAKMERRLVRQLNIVLVAAWLVAIAAWVLFFQQLWKFTSG